MHRAQFSPARKFGRAPCFFFLHTQLRTTRQPFNTTTHLQLSIAAPFLPTTCLHALRNLAAVLFATCSAFADLMTLFTLVTYAVFPNGRCFLRKSSRSMRRNFLRSHPQNISTRFKSRLLGGTSHKATVVARYASSVIRALRKPSPSQRIVQGPDFLFGFSLRNAAETVPSRTDAD